MDHAATLEAYNDEKPARSYTTNFPAIVPQDYVNQKEYVAPTFPIGPFDKFKHNPVMTPNVDHDWESAFIYNPAAFVFHDKIYLLYRAQNRDLISSIGLAWSHDGYSFTSLDRPILSPSEPYEQGGGCEDPRITSRDGLFYLTYTAYDCTTPRLCLATSRNLRKWEKHGPIFNECTDAEYCQNGRLLIKTGLSKAGAIFPEPLPDTIINVMIWGEGHLQLAESDDMIHWHTRPFNEFFATGVHSWESRLLEPGPPPIKTKDGKYILFYNAAALGGGEYAYNQYSVGQMLIDLEAIKNGPIARLEKPCLEVTEEVEKNGQVSNVVFCEGVVQFKGKWWMYYGMGDAGIGLATCDAV